MTATVPHTHTPLYRVGPRRWVNPTDAAHSQRKADNRWNTDEFPALYCCCSERVARAIARERLRRIAASLEDLTHDARPQLAEIDWRGDAVDIASSAGLDANGFRPGYPADATIEECQRAAGKWHRAGCEGVVCRSAAMHRMGVETRWEGDHQPWGEVAVFTQRARTRPRLRRLRDDLAWLENGP